MKSAIYDATDHHNLLVRRDGPSREDVQRAVAHDGTLVVEVTARFVVSQAAYERITKATLAGLIADHGLDAANIETMKIIEARDD